jgi:hypothetical protein
MTSDKTAALESYQRHVSSFETPPGCDSPALKRSFGCNSNYIFEFALESGPSLVTLTAYRHPDGWEDAAWDPSKSPPPLGECIGTLYSGPLSQAPMPGPDSNEG